MGVVTVAIVHEAKPGGGPVTIANLSAPVFLKPGNNAITFTGSVDVGELARNPVRGVRFIRQDVSRAETTQAVVVGLGSDRCEWLSRTVREMRSPIEMESTLRDVLRSVQS